MPHAAAPLCPTLPPCRTPSNPVAATSAPPPYTCSAHSLQERRVKREAEKANPAAAQNTTALRAPLAQEEPGHDSHKSGAGGGGPPAAGHGGMAEPGYGVLAAQELKLRASLGQEEPSPAATMGLASLQKTFAASFGLADKQGKTAADKQGEAATGDKSAPSGFHWKVVQDAYAGKQDAAAKATWHFFDRLSAMPSSVIDGAREELTKAGIIEAPSNLARMAAGAAAAAAAGTAPPLAAASEPPQAPPKLPEPAPLSNADRRALGLGPAKSAAPARLPAPQTEAELEAEVKRVVASCTKRVERMRGNKNERSLTKAADVLLHDTAWLPGTAQEQRLHDVKGLRKQWVDLLSGLQREVRAHRSIE